MRTVMGLNKRGSNRPSTSSSGSRLGVSSASLCEDVSRAAKNAANSSTKFLAASHSGRVVKTPT